MTIFITGPVIIVYSLLMDTYKHVCNVTKTNFRAHFHVTGE